MNFLFILVNTMKGKVTQAEVVTDIVIKIGVRHHQHIIVTVVVAIIEDVVMTAAGHAHIHQVIVSILMTLVFINLIIQGDYHQLTIN